MKKKILMLSITLLTMVMLTTPLIGSVQAYGWGKTQRIEADLIIRKAVWLEKNWDPVEIGHFTFDHYTAGGFLTEVNSPSGVLGDKSPILKNPGCDSIPEYTGPLSWRLDHYCVSFTTRNGEEKTFNTRHATYCFTNGNLEMALTVEKISLHRLALKANGGLEVSLRVTEQVD